MTMTSVVRTMQDRQQVTITLAHETDWPGFRAQARRLLGLAIQPEQVHWQVAAPAPAAGTPQSETSSLFDAFETGCSPMIEEGAPASNFALNVPSRFIDRCASVILHADPQRFALLYRLLWKFVHQPNFRHDVLDADATRARLMDHAVRRDLHKMKAFVRFRQLHGERFVAWFEPEHHIVEAVAPFFMGRFTAMHWAIITPRGSIAWDGQALVHGPAFRHRPPDDSDDAHEGLWLTYYANIFNPARLKLRAMQKEMPKKYWHNLPEASLIEPLTQQAWARSGQMIERSMSPSHQGVDEEDTEA